MGKYEREFDGLGAAIGQLQPAQRALIADVVHLFSDPTEATDAECADMSVTALRVGAAVEGHAVGWLHRFENGGIWPADGARSPAGWLDAHAETSKTRAGSRLKRSRVLASYPVIANAFAYGALADEKVRLLLDAAKRVPAAVAEQQEYLVGTIIELTVEGTHTFLASWIERALPNEPDTNDGPAPEPADGKTHLQFSKTTGGSHVNGFLEPETAAVVCGAVDAEIDLWFREGLLEGDTRTRPQLRAAALEAITARHGHPGDQQSQPRPLALVLADADTLAGRTSTPDAPNMAPVCEIVGHGPITADTARRLLCGADTSRVILRGDSEILDVGMRERFATGAQRRGLIAAARGTCEFPGCDAPHHWCQAHHLDPFNPRTGTGPTDIRNLAIVCHRHHHAIHDGLFQMTRGPTGITVHRPDGTPLTIAKHQRPPPQHGQDVA